jgi:hypothetical protein
MTRDIRPQEAGRADNTERGAAMRDAIRQLTVRVTTRLQALEGIRRDDRGASVVETVIIAAGFAGLALFVMAAIKALVEGKVAGISL